MVGENYKIWYNYQKGTEIMPKQDNSEQEIEYLEYKIKQAEQTGEPIDKYIRREISWLENQLDKFLNQMKEQGRDIDTDYEIAVIEIRQYAAMKQLALKINEPLEQYDEKIKQVQCRIFGEEYWENFFGNNN